MPRVKAFSPATKITGLVIALLLVLVLIRLKQPRRPKVVRLEGVIPEGVSSVSESPLS